MKNFLVYDGKRSCDFGLHISGSGVFNAPERDVEIIEIPGRNGNLVLDNGRYRNITVSYPAYISREFPRYAAAAREWLCSRSGYFRLEDTYNPEYFRLARFAGPIDFETRFLNWGAETNLYFDCKPQRFLKSGEQAISFSSNTTIWNPTNQDALPIINVYGSGECWLIVGTGQIVISDVNEYVTLDCDLQDAYKGDASQNENVSLNEFPVLHPGASTIYPGRGVTKIEVIPRWWTI